MRILGDHSQSSSSVTSSQFELLTQVNDPGQIHKYSHIILDEACADGNMVKLRDLKQEHTTRTGSSPMLAIREPRYQLVEDVEDLQGNCIPEALVR